MAKDGAPTEDELARRRAAQGGSVAERGAAGEGEEPTVAEDDDGQFFVWEQGTKVTLSTLVKRGIDVQHVFVFGAKRAKGKGGLMALDEQPVLVVRGITSKVVIVPTHDDQGRVTKVTIESHVAAQVVNPADSEDGMAMLAPIIERRSAA